MIENSRINTISNNPATTLVRQQRPTYLSQYNPKLPVNLDPPINSSQCEPPKSVLPSEVTPDRPPKNSNNKTNGAKTQGFQKKTDNESYPASLSSPGRPESPPNRCTDNGNNPYISYSSGHNQRHFPATPQYEQIYISDPSTSTTTNNNKKNLPNLHQIPYPSQHLLTKSPFKRVRLADDVVVTPKRYLGGNKPTNSIQPPFSRVPAYPMARNSEPSYLRPRPGPYSQFDSASDSKQQQHGDVSPPSTVMNHNKQTPQQPPQTQPPNMAHVVETDPNEVELVLKSTPANPPTNLIASSPDRSSASRGPYTQMTRGEISESAENGSKSHTLSNNNNNNNNTRGVGDAPNSLGKKNGKVKSPPRGGVVTVDRMKAGVVSPPEDGGGYSGGGGGHNRASSFNSMFGDGFGAAAPESPFNSYSQKQPKSAYNNPYSQQTQVPPQSPFRNTSTASNNPNNSRQLYFKYPPSSPVKSNSPLRTPGGTGQHNSPSYGGAAGAGAAPSNNNATHPFYNSYQPNYPPPPGGNEGTVEGGYGYQEDAYRDGTPSRGSPGKRQRVIESDDKKSSTPPYNNPPGPYHRYPNPNSHPYGVNPNPNTRYPEHSSNGAESFEADQQAYPRKQPGDGSSVGPAGRITAPSVLKASSYPPPPSPRTDTANTPSAPSYPGTTGPGRSPPPHSLEENGGEYGYGSALPSVLPGPPPSYRPEYYYPNDPAYPPNGGRMEDYPPPPRTSEQPPYYPEQPPPGGAGGDHFYDPSIGEYYHRPPPPPRAYQPHQPPPEEPNETHPLLRNYDLDRDRRVPQPPNDPNHSPQSPNPVSSPNSPEHSTISPKTPSSQKTTKDSETASAESGASVSSNSPDRRKPSTAAHAAIAAGMTQPPSAQEVDFDIHNPPLKPITLPSDDPACPVPSNVNSNDVLCGRGGGTNTQIGNRRFRSLVQEFQPIYLLCRRKEKPLIARTIVLIIRHRGGRILKKDEVSGMLFEVGDEKAEAKTSQALREGLDVRASKGSSADSKRKSRKKKPAIAPHPKCKQEANQYGEDVTMADTTPPREGPPSHNEGHPPYPGYYYGGGGYEEYPHPRGGDAGYDFHHPHHPPPYTPSRKRQRPPPPVTATGMYPYHNAPPFKGYGYPPSHAPHAPPSHQEYYPTAIHRQGAEAGAAGAGPGGEEDHSVWEMDFSPPRGFKREDGAGHGGEDAGQAGYASQENHR